MSALLSQLEGRERRAECLRNDAKAAAETQAHWPTERSEVIKHAVRADNGKWPAELPSGVMFYMGERITRAEFESVASRSNAARAFFAECEADARAVMRNRSEK